VYHFISFFGLHAKNQLIKAFSVDVEQKLFSLSLAIQLATSSQKPAAHNEKCVLQQAVLCSAPRCEHYHQM
jgi:hypothetical protein